MAEANLPPHLQALLRALQFQRRDLEGLRSFNDEQWRKTLAFGDRNQLTLALGRVALDVMPHWVRDRIAADGIRNEQRWHNARNAYKQFRAADINHVVLKGFSQCPDFVAHPAQRVQYDIDVMVKPPDLIPARDLLLNLGYSPVTETVTPVDHLPAMIRKTGWRWRGDFYDPEIPVGFELHFRLWDEETEGFAPQGLDEFWERRVSDVEVDGLRFPAFALVDRLAYSCLHLLRHLLRGDLRPGHVYELATFLDGRQFDDSFWTYWQQSHSESLRRLEGICFRIASAWYGCALHNAAQAALEADLERWLAMYAMAPLEGLVTPNKHELWLHFLLVNKSASRASILRRRLFPLTIVGPTTGLQIPQQDRTLALRIRMRASQLARMATRAVHHTRTLPPAVWHGFRWWWSGLGIAPEFAPFLLATALFELGLFVFLLLYNLHLLDNGLHEGALGAIAGAMTTGSLAAALPAGYLAGRWRPNVVLAGAFLTLAGVSVARVMVRDQTMLVGLAFCAGCLLSLWTVAFAPAISALTTERSRATAFSLFVATGIGLGVVGGALAGQLPGWFARHGIEHSRQAALLVGCGLIAASALPVLRLRIPPRAREEKAYPRSPFVYRYLAIFALWNIATGSFNPFFNAYFAQHLHMPVERIGWIFSVSQLMQVVAILAAPAALRRFGLVKGISGMQALTALAMLALAFSTPGMAAAAYVAYMAIQYMSEPGMFTLLMNQVPPGERSGASALNLFVMYGGQALAAAAAGLMVAKFGYSLPLTIAAAIALSAAICFALLLRPNVSSITEHTPSR
ncbi:MAG: MFS transporter [Bryobacteraceae bacterium]